ncbi:MAG: hypothetical protein HZB54_10040 [Deltaproteobacteria bacterium]|nr:hypothetical protein [Deltaproteobacteria bacterium]
MHLDNSYKKQEARSKRQETRGKVFPTSCFLLLTSIFLLLTSCFLLLEPASFAQEAEPKERIPAGLNPHDQIDDEGEILWGKCLICHPEIPNIKEAKSILDVKLRFEEDVKQGCFRCHPERMHPGGEWIGATLRGIPGAPNHWIKPPEYIAKNIEKSLKEADVIMPFEPKTGKIFCATCHNPHERGLLIGKADKGADYEWRLRSAGLPICQYCHRR